MLHSDWFSLIALVSANVSITMMQGDNGNIKVTLGITSFTDYLAIYMIYHCGVVFCLYNITALYNICNKQGFQGYHGEALICHNVNNFNPFP